MDSDNRPQQHAMPAYMVADLASRIHRFGLALRRLVDGRDADGSALARLESQEIRLRASLTPFHVEWIRPRVGISRFNLSLQFPGQLHPHSIC